MDAALNWDTIAWRADLSMAGTDLSADRGLKTAIILSLFCDRRALPDDTLPSPGAYPDRRGWWADRFVWPGDAAQPGSLAPADRIGSRLWLLAREKQLPDVLIRARDYAIEALDWMVRDQVAASVDVVAEIGGPGLLALGITITRPSGELANHRFDLPWRYV